MNSQAISAILDKFDQSTQNSVLLLKIAPLDNVLPKLINHYGMDAFMHAMGDSSTISQSIVDRIEHATNETLIVDFEYIKSTYLHGSMVDYLFRHFIDNDLQVVNKKVKRIIITSYCDNFALGPIVNHDIQTVQ